MRVRLSPAAGRDAESIRAYVATDRPVAAKQLLLRLLDACHGLADFPLMGRQKPGSTIRELTTVRPYVILYVVRGDTVRIVRILHSARRR